jgi:hypothetical protein
MARPLAFALVILAAWAFARVIAYRSDDRDDYARVTQGWFTLGCVSVICAISLFALQK